MKSTRATHCDLSDDGLRLTFDDGKTFLFSHAFLFSTRFTHAQQEFAEQVASQEPQIDFLNAVPDNA